MQIQIIVDREMDLDIAIYLRSLHSGCNAQYNVTNHGLLDPDVHVFVLAGSNMVRRAISHRHNWLATK